MGIFSQFKKTSKKPDQTKLDQVPTSPVVESPAAPVSTSQRTAAVLLQPTITEKATHTGTYCFKVSPAATKNEVKKAFQVVYGKKPRRVNIMNVIGKHKQRGRIIGQRANWKKAVIYLAPGETIDLYTSK